MNDVSPDLRLQRLLGNSVLSEVRQSLRRRFERCVDENDIDVIRLTGLDPAAYSALCQLTGRPSRPASSMTLKLTELDMRLRTAGLANSLRDALERLDGPIVRRTQLRNEQKARWVDVLTPARNSALLQAWLDTPGATGLVKRLGREPDRAARLLVAATAVLQCLPAKGLPRAQLAADVLGDAHALDGGQAVATLVLAVLRCQEGIGRNAMNLDMESGETSDEAETGEAAASERQRDTWARAGVLVNELARPALFLNLPQVADARCTWLAGEPAYMSLRQLLRGTPIWPIAGRRIFVCENPNVVAIAAERLGASCRPLLCTDGMPAAAQRVLLDQLAKAGALLHYHGDFDWAGLAIGNVVMRRWQAIPWRFGVRDYLRALAQTPSRPRDLQGNEIDATWDAELTTAMREYGLGIAEEAVVEELLEDLECRE